jgi:hypothetical protein
MEAALPSETLLPTYQTTRRHLRNLNLHNLSSSPNIIRKIKRRKMSWAGLYVQLISMGEMRKIYIVFVRIFERDHLQITA